MADEKFSLADRFSADCDRLFLTGSQVLTRLVLTRAWLDRADALNTGGLVSGYRGSPLGGLDRELEGAAGPLTAANIHFQPGLNEELAATALWGSQQLGLFDNARFDGVFGLWYGKGPGVDRAGDALKHANLAGTAPLGGVLAVAGDDHGALSSTTAHQSEFAFIDARIPVLAPANLQDVLDFGVAGLAASRHAGCWFGLICPSEVVERAESVVCGLDRFRWIRCPEGPSEDLHIRWPDRATDQDRRLSGPKLDAARAFIRANGLNRIIDSGVASRVGVVAAGKAWGDLVEALYLMGTDLGELARTGIRLFKPGCVWPLDAEAVRQFATGLSEIVVIEEMRPLIEPQIRDILYDAPAGSRPAITGKRDGDGKDLIPLSGMIDPFTVVSALASRLAAHGIALPGAGAPKEQANGANRRPNSPAGRPALRRMPHFCPGCPHSRSTRVPEGHQGLAGIGCHTMALWTDANTRTLTQMGGEGATWIGRAPFVATDGGPESAHVFVNMGDGTYVHSGSLAIRAAIAAGITVTFKLLVNDAVAMTGGQRVEGGLSVPAMARALAAEGVSKIRVVAENPDAYGASDPFPDGTEVHPRRKFDAVQRELAGCEGVSVLIFDQACAAEKRRRRRRGELEDPDRWVVINERVCEGCGDCQKASNCLAVVPVSTPFGEKRQVDPAACNKDESCLDGFCPAMVTVEGGRPRRRSRPAAALHNGLADRLADPAPPDLPDLTPRKGPWRLVIAGIGGTGVVTLAHIVGQAATLEGRPVAVMDQTGLAQKGGSVTCHIAIGAPGGDNGGHASRTPAGMADAMIGCDLVVAADLPQLALLGTEKTRAVIHAAHTITSSFLRRPEQPFPEAEMIAALRERVGGSGLTLADADTLARRVTGEAITANMLLLGLAWQKGLVPVGEDALRRAISLNGVAVDANLAAFHWGRCLAVDPAAVERATGLAADGRTAEDPAASAPSPAVGAIVQPRAQWLEDYGGPGLRRVYEDAVRRIGDRERGIAHADGGHESLAHAVAEGYFRVLSPKDPFEVARLFTDGEFDAMLRQRFDGDFRVHYHMAPPGLSRRDPDTGNPRKRRFGPWFRFLLRILAGMRRFRDGPLDPFRHGAGRRLERAERKEYEEDLARINRVLAPETLADCMELARLPLSIRGFGSVRDSAREKARARRAQLIAAVEAPPRRPAAAQ